MDSVSGQYCVKKYWSKCVERWTSRWVYAQVSTIIEMNLSRFPWYTFCALVNWIENNCSQKEKRKKLEKECLNMGNTWFGLKTSEDRLELKNKMEPKHHMLLRCGFVGVLIHKTQHQLVGGWLLSFLNRKTACSTMTARRITEPCLQWPLLWSDRPLKSLKSKQNLANTSRIQKWEAIKIYYIKWNENVEKKNETFELILRNIFILETVSLLV